MQNWKDYVGFQPINEADFNDTTKPLYAHYLTARDDGASGFRIFRIPFMSNDVTLTDEEVNVKVEELLTEFPTVHISKNYNPSIDLERAKIQVAKDSMRAAAQTNYNNTWFYKGSYAFDVPIIVCGIDDKYIVLKHPNFEKYGFNVA